MKSFTAIIFALVLCFSLANAQNSTKITIEKKLDFQNSPELEKLLKNAVDETLKKLSSNAIKPEEIAATVIDLSDAKNYKTANFNGEMKIYPASVVKMFYLAAIHQRLEDGKIKITPELERGLKDMIVDSSNDATHYIFDILTETGGGAELSPEELEKYAFKKNAVNRYFQTLGYSNININQKTYCEDIYGRERQFWDGGKQRNMLTTNATARLLAEIVQGKTVSAERSRKMLDLMKRDPFAPTKDEEDQAHGFTGISLKELGLKDAKLFSKAGWTSTTRHDAAYIEMPDGLKLVIVIFTRNHAKERTIIPGIATKIIGKLRK